ncbi:MAG TPA: MFS transporter [Vicinamibacterales bacterium]|nr:MFS transporter [Vicinamibacterales bacterium]
MTDAATTLRNEKAVRRHQIRAVVSASVGTTIEWYDFFLYGVAAAAVFPQKFFPGSDPFIATMLSFTTFFVGFVARPVGAAIFGHFGDRVGRKKLLVFTMIVMGASTMAVGLTPGYDVIGVWGAVLLTLGRILQGLAIGGQWSGSVLMAAEWTDPKRRGFTTSFAQLGAPAGMVLANGALALMTGLTSDQQFLEWGWRIPFLASVALVITGFYIRAGVHETPVFEELKKSGAVVKAPLVEVLRNNGKEVALTALMRTSQQVCFYIYTTYVITYATTVLGFGRGVVLNMVMTMAVVSCLANPLFGHLSDVYGRKTITAIGCVIMIVFPFVYFGLLDTRSLPLVFLAIVISNPIQDIQYGPQAAFIAESFPGSVRYSGSALGYQLASITAGGPAPLIATFLLREYGTSSAIAVYISLCSVLSLICVFLLKEHRGQRDRQ